ncbi:ATP-dependent DNA ligase [soil metagenome]
MRDFALLYNALDETNKTNEKVAAMESYFLSAPAADAIWAVNFLIGRRPKRLVKSANLSQWAREAADLPEWLFAESYGAVGDTAETISLVLPEANSAISGPVETLEFWVKNRLLNLAGKSDEEQRTVILSSWRELDRLGKFVYTKLITGAFRVGVSQDLVVRALSKASNVPTPVIAHRLMGNWAPSAEFFERLISPDAGDSDVSQPYPFCLAHALDQEPAHLGSVSEWFAEWKWDGIRAQVIRRDGQSFIWSRGEELITERFPEVEAVCAALPNGTVLDGEILAWQNDKPMKFAELQKRIGRKILSKRILETVPVMLVAFDLLEFEGVDLRERPLIERRAILEQLISDLGDGLSIRAAPEVPASSWSELAELRATARERNVEGLMLKRRDSAYLVGRKKGHWWKWKIEPMTVDCVMIYAQRGSGKRASLYTDYTFGVWSEGKLVPFAKAYSGLTDAEIRQVDSWVRRNTIERFGPVRSVNPELVFELAFESIQLSTRHKSGVAVRFPRISRWRHDKRVGDADSLETITDMLRGL